MRLDGQVTVLSLRADTLFLDAAGGRGKCVSSGPGVAPSSGGPEGRRLWVGRGQNPVCNRKSFTVEYPPTSYAPEGFA